MTFSWKFTFLKLIVSKLIASVLVDDQKITKKNELNNMPKQNAN